MKILLIMVAFSVMAAVQILPVSTSLAQTQSTEKVKTEEQKNLERIAKERAEAEKDRKEEEKRAKEDAKTPDDPMCCQWGNTAGP